MRHEGGCTPSLVRAAPMQFFSSGAASSSGDGGVAEFEGEWVRS